MAGIWSEDQVDAIFHYGTVSFPIKQIDLNKKTYVTVTHFWQPDHRDAWTILTPLGPLGDPFKPAWTIRAPNSLHKALMYAYGQDSELGDWEMHYQINNDLYYLQSQPILELFNATQLYVVKKYDINKKKYNISPYWLDFGDAAQGRAFCYNILGRVAHLLTDASVPAHVHETTHPDVLYPDKYEAYMENGQDNGAVTYWTAERVFEEKGDFINPYCAPSGMTPVEYLMTIVAQVSDHFATRRANGNDVMLQGGIAGKRIQQYVIEDDKNGINTYNTPGPTTIEEYNASNSAEMIAIRDATFPLAIRATAGLLYWFLMETHQIDPNTRCVNFGYLIGHTLRGRDYMFRAGGNEAGVVWAVGHPFFGPTIIESTAKNVVFKASQEVRFSPGFEAKSGCEVSAFIGSCDDCDHTEIYGY